MDLSELLDPAVSIAQITGAILMFAWPLPRREHFAWRLTGVLVLIGVATVAGAWIGNVTMPELTGTYLTFTEFILYSCVFALAVPILLFLFDTNAWTALTFAATGYTLQNLTSGTVGLISLLAGLGSRPVEIDPVEWLVLVAIVTASIYGIGYLTFGRVVRSRRLIEAENHSMVIIFAAVILVVIAFDVVNKKLPSLGASAGDVILLRCIHGTCCGFLIGVEYELLYNRHLKTSVAALERAAADEAKIYESSRVNAQAINMKMHDIRHQLNELETLGYVGADELEGVISKLHIYDANLQTGSEALDTILTEKGLICEQKGITLGCVADGACLGFMAPADIYSLFGDAVENAIEAVEKIPDPERRAIDLVVKQVGAMVSAHIENYFSGGVNLVNGLPRSTDHDSAGRGFGTRYMRAVAERYGGSITMSTDGGLFRLDILIPIPEEASA